MKALYIFILIVGISTNLFGTLNEQGERTTKSTISLELGGGTIGPGISYNYFLNKNIEVDMGILPLILFNTVTFGLKYHLYISNNLTTYISVNNTLILEFITPTIFSSFSSLVGLRYETDFGLTGYFGLGTAFFSAHQRPESGEGDGYDNVKAAFYPYAGVKIGYAF